MLGSTEHNSISCTKSTHEAVNILLIEDNLADVRLFRRALQQTEMRHCLSVLHDGEDAVEYLFRRGEHAGAIVPDLIVLDLNLPRKSGLEILKEIRADRALKRTPVVVLTSSAHQSDVNTAYENGANMYLLKRHSLAEIEDMVHFIATTWLETATLPEVVEH
ncbi:MAG: response regulator [Bryobacteraceae bacterium]